MAIIAFYECQLLVCRNAVSLYKLVQTVYPATFLNWLIISRSFLLEIVKSLIYNNTLTANRNTSYFPYLAFSPQRSQHNIEKK